MDGNLRVIVVEDDSGTHDWVCQCIEDDPRLTLAASARTLARGKKLLSSAHDVLVVDLGLPDGSGIELVRRSADDASTRCLILSVFGDNKSVLDAIAAGADGYVLKDTTDLPSAIVDVANGQVPLSPSVAAHVLRKFRGQRRRPRPTYALTPRETETLEQLARGLSYREAARALGISHNTIADHVKVIYRKLSVNSRGGAVYKGLQAGLIHIHPR